MGIAIEITGQAEKILLTEFSVQKYNERFDPEEHFNEEVAKYTHGIEFSGKANLYDTTGEVAEVCKLMDWFKKTANDEDAYRRMVVGMSDANSSRDDFYRSTVFSKAFIVRYEESYSVDKGNISFCAFIRDFGGERGRYI